MADEQLQDDVENATAGSEPECDHRNWTADGNCSALNSAMVGGSPGMLMILSLMLYGLICAAGTIGNGLVIYVVLRSVSPSVCLSVCHSDCASLLLWSSRCSLARDCCKRPLLSDGVSVAVRISASDVCLQASYR